MQGKHRTTLVSEHGFTLIELMITAVVLGILTLIAIPSYLGLKNHALDAANKANVREIVPPIAAFYADHQTYSGMTVTALQAYDQGLDAAKYTIGGTGAATYCVQSPQGTDVHVFRKNGPAADFEKNHC